MFFLCLFEPINLICMSLDCGRTPLHQEKTNAAMRTTHKIPHRKDAIGQKVQIQSLLAMRWQNKPLPHCATHTHSRRRQFSITNSPSCMFLGDGWPYMIETESCYVATVLPCHADSFVFPCNIIIIIIFFFYVITCCHVYTSTQVQFKWWDVPFLTYIIPPCRISTQTCLCIMLPIKSSNLIQASL